jgi:hypothetical protein
MAAGCQSVVPVFGLIASKALPRKNPTGRFLERRHDGRGSVRPGTHASELQRKRLLLLPTAIAAGVAF